MAETAEIVCTADASCPPMLRAAEIVRTADGMRAPPIVHATDAAHR
ncbi:hypothetical protein [Pseudoscardovia radai]